jgi:hypothetical protein
MSVSCFPLLAVLLSSGAAEEPGAAPRDVVEHTSVQEGEAEVQPVHSLSWLALLRVGGGYDTNVLHDFDALDGAPVVRGEGFFGIEPATDLRLTVSGFIEPHIGFIDLNEGEARTAVMYRWPISNDVSLRAASLTAYRREVTVFAEGSVLTKATLRSEVYERPELVLAYRLGSVDFELIGDSDIKRVRGAERYLLFAGYGALSVRWVPTSTFAVRCRGGYGYRRFDGLKTANEHGTLVAGASDLRLGVYGGSASVRYRIASLFWLAGRYDFYHYSDAFLGYYDSDEQIGRLQAYFDIGDRGHVAADFEFRNRQFPLRQTISRDNLRAETELRGFLAGAIWLTNNLGIYARYEVERASAEPTGVLYTRHLFTIGPGGRLGSDSRERVF